MKGIFSYLCELSQVVQGSQSVKLLQSQNQGLMRRRVHEVKVDQVVDPWTENKNRIRHKDWHQTEPPVLTESSPKLFSSRTTFPRLVLWISGTVVSSISCLKAQAVYRRKHFPAATLPARPALWLAEACERNTDSFWFAPWTNVFHGLDTRVDICLLSWCLSDGGLGFFFQIFPEKLETFWLCSN